MATIFDLQSNEMDSTPIWCSIFYPTIKNGEGFPPPKLHLSYSCKIYTIDLTLWIFCLGYQDIFMLPWRNWQPQRI